MAGASSSVRASSGTKSAPPIDPRQAALYSLQGRALAREGSDAPPLPVYQEISERPLTPEEIAHFEALAKTYSLHSST